MKAAARKISFKIYEFHRLDNAIAASELPLNRSVNWKGMEMIKQQEQQQELDPIQELAAAKQRSSSSGQGVTCRSCILIEEGQGRATRELELIWWPDLYSCYDYGKMCLRIFVSKVHLSNF